LSSPSEKITELYDLLEKPSTKSFGEVHKRIEEIMGRPVWTHEIAFPEHLYTELRVNTRGTAFFEGLREIENMGKPVVTLTLDEDTDPKEAAKKLIKEIKKEA